MTIVRLAYDELLDGASSATTLDARPKPPPLSTPRAWGVGWTEGDHFTTMCIMRNLQRAFFSVGKPSPPVLGDMTPSRLQKLMTVVHRAVPFAHWCLVINDPRVGGFSVASLAGTPTAINAQRRFWDVAMELADASKAIALARCHPRVLLLDAAKRSDLAPSVARWQEMLRPHGIGDELRMTLTSERRWWGSLALYREHDDPLFTHGDARTASQLAPSLTEAARSSWIKAVQSPFPPLRHAGVLLVNSADERLGTTPAADEWLARLNTGQSDGNLIACLRARLNSRATQDDTVNTLTRDTYGNWVEISAARVNNRSRRDVIAVTFAPAASEVISDVLLHAYPFTARERQIVTLTIADATTKEIGEHLRLSRYTVADYLKSIFLKTGAHSRNDLARVMTGRWPGLATL